MNVYDKHAPFKTKRVRTDPKLPWLSQHVKDAMNYRDFLLASGSREEFTKQRNLVTFLKRQAKKEYFRKLVSTKSDAKSIWNAINSLTNKNVKSKTVLPPDLSPDKLNVHFCEIAQSTIKSDKTSLNNLEVLQDFCASKSISSELDIPLMSVHEVFNALIHFKQTGTRGLDGTDGTILKIAAPVVSETLTYVYNLCINKNQFPKAFKVAKVLPLFKSGDRIDPSNYRPISILSNLSKPLENHIRQHLLNHFDQYNLFHPNQSGF